MEKEREGNIKMNFRELDCKDRRMLRFWLLLQLVLFMQDISTSPLVIFQCITWPTIIINTYCQRFSSKWYKLLVLLK